MEIISTNPVSKISERVMNILIVDDRPENLLTLESVIEKCGRNIIKAAGGNEALRLAIKEDIGLILLDIQMPDIDGVEVAGLLRSNSKTRHIPIIFVSAVSKSERPLMNQFEEGTVDCLYKPLDLEDTKIKVAVFERLYHLSMEKREAEKTIEKLNKQHEQFVYFVSHDLKSPLRAMDNLTNWITDDLGNAMDPNTSENLLLLRSRLNRMSALLEGLLDYSRSGRIAEALVEMDLNQLTHGIFESIEGAAGFKFQTDNLPVILCQRTRIYKIFYNLIVNAIDHHHNPGDGAIEVACEKSVNEYIFKVTDNGPGIKPQYHSQVFELFKTLKSKDEKETTGVGLTIVQKLIEDAGGRIWIENIEAEGTVVKFSWPINI
ncbi:MAG: response regulator [Bacteroidetes bacterium]|nr:response regulator [Bacteroidota bacterium]